LERRRGPNWFEWVQVDAHAERSSGVDVLARRNLLLCAGDVGGRWVEAGWKVVGRWAEDRQTDAHEESYTCSPAATSSCVCLTKVVGLGKESLQKVVGWGRVVVAAVA
jgi:hypothetical protein